MKLLIFAGLTAVAMSALAAANNADNCPIEKAIAQITNIDPGSSAVKLFRSGSSQALMAHVGQCLLIGDRVEAGSAIVTIDTAQDRQLIGRYQDSPTYVAAKLAVSEVPQGVLATVQAAFNRLIADIGRRAPGTGRGDAVGCGPGQSTADTTLSALRSLPGGEQKIGSDLTSLLIAWDPLLGRQDVLLRFTQSDGRVIAQQHVCGGGQYRFKIDAVHRKNGARITVTASTKRGAPLTWQVNIVDPSVLPHPSESAKPSWLLEAW
jgi:hypothetical protein